MDSGRWPYDPHAPPPEEEPDGWVIAGEEDDGRASAGPARPGGPGPARPYDPAGGAGAVPYSTDPNARYPVPRRPPAAPDPAGYPTSGYPAGNYPTSGYPTSGYPPPAPAGYPSPPGAGSQPPYLPPPPAAPPPAYQPPGPGAAGDSYPPEPFPPRPRSGQPREGWSSDTDAALNRLTRASRTDRDGRVGRDGRQRPGRRAERGRPPEPDPDTGVEAEAELEPPAGWATVAAWVVGFFMVPVLFYLLWAFTRSGVAPPGCADAGGVPCPSPRDEAITSLLDVVPAIGGALALALVASAVLRLLTAVWRPGTVGFAAAVIGAGIATLIANVVG